MAAVVALVVGIVGTADLVLQGTQPEGEAFRYHRVYSDENGVSHPGRKIEVPEKYEKVEVSAPQGAICLQNGNTIHGSAANFSEVRSHNHYTMCYINKGESFQP